MFAKLMLVSMWSASATFGMTIDKSAVESNIERNVGDHLWAIPAPTPKGRIHQALDKAASMWSTSKKDPFLTPTEADDEDREYLFKYIKGLPQFAGLKDEDYAKVMKNREKHRKLASLYGDSREVEAMFEDVGDMLERLSSRKEHPNGLLKNYFDAFKLSQTFKQELSIYKQVKFWQIINSHSKISKSDNTAKKPVGHVNPGGKASISQQIKKKIAILQKNRLKNLNVESSEWQNENLVEIILENFRKDKSIVWLHKFPPEILSLIPEETWKMFAVNFVQKMTDHILDHRVNQESALHSEELIYVWTMCFPHLFKMIDFLYRNEFIDSKTIRGIFQHTEILDLANLFTKNKFENIMRWTPYCKWSPLVDINAHWFWPFGFKFYDAFDQKEKLQMNLSGLISNIKDAGNELFEHRYLPDEWHYLTKSFGKYKTYLTEAQKSEEILTPSEPQVNKDLTINLNIKNQEELKNDAENLISLLVKINHPHDYYDKYTTGKQDISGAICELLDFIEQNLYPGIIKLVCHDEEVEDEYHFILVSSRIIHLADMARNYKMFSVAGMGPSSRSYPSKSKYVRRAYIQAILDMYPELLEIGSKIVKKWPRWFGQSSEMRRLFLAGLNALEEPGDIGKVILPFKITDKGWFCYYLSVFLNKCHLIGDHHTLRFKIEQT
ncbi:hypothetical protein PGT21_034385 [Puccinia graminis f. sp. tritici]|uniref:Uncharacterized protein n=2 Tax=Puccinia graminis f. sp. tritici TaxID=56615 RepID=A0A5B0NVX5_PUCGR|nr:hypothetical protein PGT21_034385 [Puccinia graminis f. sp. tritici]KAA1092019.1 hypothetical protein PGTUg99_014971 [Puccinia graminis f. sp. tritici]